MIISLLQRLNKIIFLLLYQKEFYLYETENSSTYAIMLLKHVLQVIDYGSTKDSLQYSRKLTKTREMMTQ
jgi:hypothetical protein